MDSGYGESYGPQAIAPLTLAELGAAPGAVPDAVQLYGFDDGGVTQLYARLSDGTTLDLTPSGGAAPNDAAYLTNGAVAGLSAEVNIQSLTADLSFANSTGSLINLDIDLEVVINDSSQDINLRVESDANTNLAQFDAGLNSIGLGAAAAADVRLSIAFPTLTVTADAVGSFVSVTPLLTEAGSGNHARLAGLSLDALSVTGGAATVTDTATLYIAGASSATVSGGNFALWVDAGNARFDGVILNAGGTAAAPSYTFFGDVDTGIFSDVADNVKFATAGVARISVDATGDIGFDQGVSTSGSPTAFLVTAAAHTTLAASTEAIDINFNLARTVQFATGALTTQRSVVVQSPTIGFSGASTLTNNILVDLFSAPNAGTNATVTSSRALRVGATAVSLGPTSASMNYAAIGVPAHTVTVTGTTQVTTTASAFSAVLLGQVTITDASAVTVDNAATLYIAGAPVAAGSVTLTSAYSIWVDAGTSRFDGTINITAGGIDHDAGNIGLFGSAPVTQQVGGVALVNNITAGGTTNQLDDWTDLTTYSNAAAAIRNAAYQNGRKLRLVVEALRTYGILAGVDS